MWLLQRNLGITEQQKDALYRLRRHYIVSMALVAKRRQQLLRQLQAAAEIVSLNNADTQARAKLEQHIQAQLHECTIQENRLFMAFMGALGHQVCLQHN